MATAVTPSSSSATPGATPGATPTQAAAPPPPGTPWLAALQQATGHAARPVASGPAAGTSPGSDADDGHDTATQNETSPVASRPSACPPSASSGSASGSASAPAPPAAKPPPKSRPAKKSGPPRPKKSQPKSALARASVGDDDLDELDGNDPDSAPGTGAGRKAQNRIAQREFRQRKQEYIKALETSVEQLAVEQNDEVMHLRYMLHQLMLENNQIRDVVATLGTFAGGVTNVLGNGFSETEMSDIEVLLASTSERTVTRAWHTWPGKTPSELLQKLRAQSDLPPEGLPESADRLIARYHVEPGSAGGPSATAAPPSATASGTNGSSRRPARKATDDLTSPQSKRARTSDVQEDAGGAKPRSASLSPQRPPDGTGGSAVDGRPSLPVRSMTAIDTAVANGDMSAAHSSLRSAPPQYGSEMSFGSGMGQAPSSQGSNAPTSYPPINLPGMPGFTASGGDSVSNGSGMDLLMQFLRASGQGVSPGGGVPGTGAGPNPMAAAQASGGSSGQGAAQTTPLSQRQDGPGLVSTGRNIDTPPNNVSPWSSAGSPGDVFNSVSVLAALYDPAYPWSAMPLPNSGPNGPQSFLHPGAGPGGPPNSLLGVNPAMQGRPGMNFGGGAGPGPMGTVPGYGTLQPPWMGAPGGGPAWLGPAGGAGGAGGAHGGPPGPGAQQGFNPAAIPPHFWNQAQQQQQQQQQQAQGWNQHSAAASSTPSASPITATDAQRPGSSG